MRKKIISLLFFALLPILTFCIITIYQSHIFFHNIDHLIKNSNLLIKNTIQNNTISIGNNIALDISEFILRAKQILKNITMDKHIKGYNINEQKYLLETILHNFHFFKELAIIDINGKELVKVSSSRVILPSELQDMRFNLWFRLSIQGNEYISNVFYEDKTQKPFVIISLPIERYKGNVIGVLTAKLNLEEIWNKILSTKLSYKGIIYIVNNDGQIILHPDKDFVKTRKRLIDHPVVTEIIMGRKKGVKEITDSKNRKLISAFMAINETNWSIIVQQHLPEIHSPVRYQNYIKTLLLYFGIIIIITSIIIIIFSHYCKTYMK